MATDKRARQRANRETKKAAQAKQARRELAIKRIRRIVIYGIVIAIVLFLASQIWGGNGDDAVVGHILGA
jgi:hypothetical protein